MRCLNSRVVIVTALLVPFLSGCIGSGGQGRGAAGIDRGTPSGGLVPGQMPY